MKLKIAISSFLCILILNSTLAGPITDDLDPEWTAGKFEGDMLLTPEQIQMISRPQRARNGLIGETKHWPNGIVYYKIIGQFDSIHRTAIRNAIAIIEERTCLRFFEARNDQSAFIAIGSKTGGCFTAVGYHGKQQEMNLQNFPIDEGCFRRGSILHEFMHALGFYHEQSATDRDDYIEVLYDNIVPGKEFNFKKYYANTVSDFDVGYDYESCLHYGYRAFSKNGERTIVPKDPNAVIGQRVGLSKKDIDKINVMYKCPIEI